MIPLRPGPRPSALHRGDFRPRDHASTPAVFTGSTLRLARRPDRKIGPTGSRTSRAAVRYRRPRDATPRSVWWIVSGDAPHERERIWCSTDAICSQQRSWNVVVLQAIFWHPSQEGVPFTRERSQVQSLQRPPRKSRHCMVSSFVPDKRLGQLATNGT